MSNVRPDPFLFAFRLDVGQNNPLLEWVAVRPDDLCDENVVSGYKIHASPTRNPVFDAGKTSRINVANFMTRLVTDEDLWSHWKGKMPVIYNPVTTTKGPNLSHAQN